MIILRDSEWIDYPDIPTGVSYSRGPNGIRAGIDLEYYYKGAGTFENSELYKLFFGLNC